MEKTIFFILLAIFCINSCKNICKTITNDNNFIELEKANWIIGEWQNISSEGISTEIWKKKNDSTYVGKSYFVVNKDTLFNETISIEQIGKQLFYIPIVIDQNNGKPVIFTLTSSNKSQLIFENPKHDFPQKITYTLISNYTLLAEISGLKEGKQNSQKFPMTRVK